jgi:hypothetical protein
VIERRLREAHFAFTLSLSINPANLAAHRGLSRVTALRGDRRAARLAAERGLRFHPNDAELQQQLKELSAGGAPTQ